MLCFNQLSYWNRQELTLFCRALCIRETNEFQILPIDHGKQEWSRQARVLVGLIVNRKTSYSTKSAICTREGCPFVWVCSINCLGHAFCSMLSVTCCNLKGQHSLAALVSYPFWLQQAPSSMLQKAGPHQLSDHTDKWTPFPRAYNRLSAIISQNTDNKKCCFVQQSYIFDLKYDFVQSC